MLLLCFWSHKRIDAIVIYEQKLSKKEDESESSLSTLNFPSHFPKCLLSLVKKNIGSTQVYNSLFVHVMNDLVLSGYLALPDFSALC